MEQELQFLLYDLPDESAKVQVVVRDETVWMTQKAMSVLFGVDFAGGTEEKAHAEYEIYNRTQPIESDFDHFLELEAEVKPMKEGTSLGTAVGEVPDALV